MNFDIALLYINAKQYVGQDTYTSQWWYIPSQTIQEHSSRGLSSSNHLRPPGPWLSTLIGPTCVSLPPSKAFSRSFLPRGQFVAVSLCYSCCFVSCVSDSFDSLYLKFCFMSLGLFVPCSWTSALSWMYLLSPLLGLKPGRIVGLWLTSGSPTEELQFSIFFIPLDPQNLTYLTSPLIISTCELTAFTSNPLSLAGS